MGRVVYLHPGRDGRVRNVEVKLENNTLTRSIQRLHRLEVQPQSERVINNEMINYNENQGTVLSNDFLGIEPPNDFTGFEPENDFLGFESQNEFLGI